jgi:hypothetical protein
MVSESPVYHWRMPGYWGLGTSAAATQAAEAWSYALRIAASVGSAVGVGVAISAGVPVGVGVDVEMDAGCVDPHPARPRAAAAQRSERSWAS